MLLSNLHLTVNQDINSRVTYSVITRRLRNDATGEFILRELDRIGLPHRTFAVGASNRPSESEFDGESSRPERSEKRSVITALQAGNAAWLAGTITNRPRPAGDAIPNRSTAAEALRNSQQLSRAPPQKHQKSLPSQFGQHDDIKQTGHRYLSVYLNRRSDQRSAM